MAATFLVFFKYKSMDKGDAQKAAAQWREMKKSLPGDVELIGEYNHAGRCVMRCWAFLGMTASLWLVAGAGGGQDADDLARERQLIRGPWVVVEYDQDGKALPRKLVARLSVTFGPERVVIRPRLTAVRAPKFTAEPESPWEAGVSETHAPG